MDPWLVRAAAMRPDTVAVAEDQRRLSYAALLAAAQRGADELARRGVSPGDRVALALPPGVDFAVALHACLLVGFVAVPIDLRLSEAERAGRGEGALVLDEALPLPAPAASGEAARSAAGEPAGFSSGQTAVIVHTSGTTSRAKPIPLSYGNFQASALGSAVALGLDSRERWLCPMPLAHVGGISVLTRSAIYATTAILQPRFDTQAALGTLMSPAEGITLVSLVPTMLSRLLEAGLRRPPALRAALLGGGPIAPALLERAEAAGVPVAPTYGMTEACSQIATGGWPLPGLEVALDDPASQGEGGDATGEILVRGATVSRAALAEDGWLHTGDLGSFDARGRLTIVGRRADTIVSGGENVAPAEVEAVLLSHPAVIDAGVYGRPDEEWGEAVIARVVLHGEASAEEAELRAYCRGRLASFKVPKRFEFASELPRTASGKLLRRQLG